MNNKQARMMAMAGLLTLSGCAATTTPDTDARFGESMNLIKAQQTLNPDASLNTDPVAGVDGKAAKGAYDNYRDSFRKPPMEAAAPLITNSISSGGGQ